MKQVQYIRVRDTPRERRFYLLPSVHKDRTTWPLPDIPPGRPIVSNCGSESYGVTELITWYLGPLSPYQGHIRFPGESTNNENKSRRQSLLHGRAEPINQYRNREGTGGGQEMPAEISRGGEAG